MSVILITNHDESIYKISEKTGIQVQDTKSATYFKSKLRERAHVSQDRGTKGHATMGRPQETLPDPSTYLKRRTGHVSHSTKEDIEAGKHTCVRIQKQKLYNTKEVVLEYDKRRQEEKKNIKDFITKNIKTVLKMKPKEPEPKIVLDPHGERKRLIDGLEPIYIKSNVFGKTPQYLENFIKQNEKMHQMKKDSTGLEQPKCQYIRRDIREQLLAGLKHNWEELQKQYQGLPILTDTIPKINRKSKLEAELKQLEKDIVLVERHPYIYIYEDDIIS